MFFSTTVVFSSSFHSVETSDLRKNLIEKCYLLLEPHESKILICEEHNCEHFQRRLTSRNRQIYNHNHRRFYDATFLRPQLQKLKYIRVKMFVKYYSASTSENSAVQICVLIMGIANDHFVNDHFSRLEFIGRIAPFLKLLLLSFPIQMTANSPVL